MFFNKLIIKGFKRTALAGIKDIELTFTSYLQVFLGTNGCGKTSVMKQTTPWPPETEDYYPGGGKEFHAVRNGDVYVLRSVLKSKWVHEFWQNGINLNPGGTTPVQKELVQRYFKLTQEIYNLMVGNTKFHLLSTAKRRELFTAISPTDLTYVLGVYNRLKSAARDNLGVRKHLESRIAQETAKLIDDATAEQYATQASLLNQEVELLLSNRRLDIDSRSAHDTEVLLAQCNYSINRYLDNMAYILPDSIGEFESMDGLNAGVKAAEERATMLRTKRDALSSEFVELNTTLMDIKNRSMGSRSDVEAQLAKATNSLAIISADFTFKLPENCKEAFQETEEFEVPLISELTAMAGMLTEDFDYSQASSNAAKEAYASTQKRLSDIERAIDRLRHRQEHLDNAQETDCPKCETRFVPGERRGERKKLAEQLTAGEVARNQTKAELSLCEQRCNDFAAFEASLAKARSIAVNYPRCRGLFDKMIDAGFPYKTNQQHIGMVWTWKEELKRMFELTTLKSTQEQLLSALDQMKLSEGESGVVLEGRAKRLELEIFIANREALEADAERKRLLEIQENVTLFMESYEKACGMLTALDRTTKEGIISLRNELIEQLLREHQGQLGRLNSRLKERDVAMALLNDLRKQLDEAKAKEIAFKHLMDAISPSDGLIAEQLTGFIATFVRSVNVILEKVWTYPIRMLPCGMENEELNYRFPAEIGEDRELSQDVANTSEAQRDVFDFAFVVALGLYLEPENGWPLFLDELGSSFDEEHRTRIWQFVKDFVDGGKAPQAFMISHYAANHSALSSAEIMVLDSNNITVPRKHNEHVIMS